MGISTRSARGMNLRATSGYNPPMPSQRPFISPPLHPKFGGGQKISDTRRFNVIRLELPKMLEGTANLDRLVGDE